MRVVNSQRQYNFSFGISILKKKEKKNQNNTLTQKPEQDIKLIYQWFISNWFFGEKISRFLSINYNSNDTHEFFHFTHKKEYGN